MKKFCKFRMKNTLTEIFNKANCIEDRTKRQEEDNHEYLQSRTSQPSQEKSLRITIRVPTRSHLGKRSTRRRVGVLESATDTESEELSPLSDPNEDEEIAHNESLDTDDIETFVSPPCPQSTLPSEASRLTKRQRARIEEELAIPSDLVQLPEMICLAVKRRHQNLTEEELALKER
ncbi:unnamed protein product [Pneumocystis jirovecii]|uniref:Uncharacterized protein n=1 Tax=Pneumocystis jirovecii TaxID=42068 RepID=L0PDS5_PNEJI|nr:unnamed protein product [Pneumocystis jirovecii]